MSILAGRLRYQHRPPQMFRSAAGVARTWLPGWQPARAQRLAQRLALQSALAAARWVSLGRVQQQQAFMREQARMDEQRFQQQRVDEVAQWNANQARRAPYRQASLSILARRMGQPELANPAPQTRPPMTPTQPPPRQVPVATQMGAGRSVVDTMANGQRQTLADLARRRTR